MQSSNEEAQRCWLRSYLRSSEQRCLRHRSIQGSLARHKLLNLCGKCNTPQDFALRSENLLKKRLHFAT
jgi:hypothetical protein